MDKKMKLSSNLTLGEMVKSRTAEIHGIENIPNDQELSKMKLWAKCVFQPARNHFMKAIAVTSGFRCEKLNAHPSVRGSKTSQHRKGEAGDMDADVFGGVRNSDIFHFIRKNLDFDQLIWELGDDKEPAWVHSSYSQGHNRKEVLVCYREGKKRKYKKYIES